MKLLVYVISGKCPKLGQLASALLDTSVAQVQISLAMLAKVSISEEMSNFLRALFQWFDCHLPGCGGYTRHFLAKCRDCLVGFPYH